MGVHGVRVISIPGAGVLDQVVRQIEDLSPGLLEAQLREAVMNRVLTDSEVVIDDGVLEARVDLMIDRFKQQLEDGVTFEQCLEESDRDLVTLRLELGRIARDTLKKEAVLHQIAETHGIAVSAEDLDEPVSQLARMLGADVEETRARLTREGRMPTFFQTVLFEKVTDFLVDTAKEAAGRD